MAAQTDPATLRRLQRAYAAGDRPRSQSLKRGLTWAAALWVLPSAIGSLWEYGKGTLTRAIRLSHTESPDLPHATADALHDLTRLSTPLLVLVLAASLAAHLIENRGLLTAAAARERINRFTLVRSTVAQWMPWVSVAALVAYGWHWWLRHAADVARVLGRSTLGRDLTTDGLQHLAWIACATWLVTGGLELALSRHAWLQRLSPTQEEKRREQRETEGDPWLASRRREQHVELLDAPALGLLSETDFIIHADYHTAALLRYAHGRDDAPRIMAIAIGQTASAVIREALSIKLPIFEDVVLTQALARCHQGSRIPENTYHSVALLLSGSTQTSAGTLSLDTNFATRGS